VKKFLSIFIAFIITFIPFCIPASAGEIAEVIEEISYHGGAYIFIEREHAAYADKILKETGASAFYLNPLTVGDGEVDSYYEDKMKNLDTLRLLKND